MYLKNSIKYYRYLSSIFDQKKTEKKDDMYFLFPSLIFSTVSLSYRKFKFKSEQHKKKEKTWISELNKPQKIPWLKRWLNQGMTMQGFLNCIMPWDVLDILELSKMPF